MMQKAPRSLDRRKSRIEPSALGALGGAASTCCAQLRNWIRFQNASHCTLLVQEDDQCRHEPALRCFIGGASTHKAHGRLIPMIAINSSHKWDGHDCLAWAKQGRCINRKKAVSNQL